MTYEPLMGESETRARVNRLLEAGKISQREADRILRKRRPVTGHREPRRFHRMAEGNRIVRGRSV